MISDELWQMLKRALSRTLAGAMEWLLLMFVSTCLRRIEKKTCFCNWALKHKGNEQLSSKMDLSQKAVASSIATTYLFRKRLVHEAEVTQRVFLETWTLLMYFIWFPDEGAFTQWLQHPQTPINQRQFPHRQRVEEEIPKRLELSYGQQLSIKEMFRLLSNTSVHPTKDATERAWSNAADRVGIRFDNAIQNQREELSYVIRVSAVVVFLAQLHVFLQFLRRWLFSDVNIPIKFRQLRKSILEAYLDRWLAAFKKSFQERLAEVATKDEKVDAASSGAHT